MADLTVTLAEWQEFSPEPGSPLAGVFLDPDPAIQRQVAELSNSERLELSERRQGLYIRAFAHVGSIQLGSLRITIQPKVSGAPLLNLVRYAYRLRNLHLFSALDIGSAVSTFQDLLCYQLVAEATELLSRGLHRQYRPVAEPLSSPRGRIDFERVANQAGLVEPVLPCIHYPRLENNLLNQALLAGVDLAVHLTNDLTLRSTLRRTAALLQEQVVQKPLNRELLGRALRSVNRLTTAYRPALTLVELLANAYGVVLDDQERLVNVPGFLFDMNRFFQALLSRFLKENLPGYSVRDEHGIKGMMAYVPRHNPNRRRPPTPRPDYVIIQGAQPVAMLDAKYRDLWLHELPRDMLYQLAIYALSQSGDGSAAILYPTVDQAAREARIEIRHPQTEQRRGTIVLRPVNLVYLEGLINDRRAYSRDRISLARQMAFGDSA